MNVDDLHSIEDYLPETLRQIIERVENSRTFEQMIYRESELDEVWRLLDNDIAGAARNAANPAKGQNLVALRELIIEAHDLIGNESNTVDARERLLKAVALV
ncbi:conserved hypothetical protein [Paraburkholderia piptadeniae]|uniref:Uncharacterized protein n=1 Tax=Paraburkholderia piptadeniae TaxID=1701573 RepID=A0A1N7SN39_9BURK|nr:hypothetical protein [Paraburkholderia piptadeniae]SIT48819.1 conserved hypothetical protein [Paraburkholderia piptadeniae]